MILIVVHHCQTPLDLTSNLLLKKYVKNDSCCTHLEHILIKCFWDKKIKGGKYVRDLLCCTFPNLLIILQSCCEISDGWEIVDLECMNRFLWPEIFYLVSVFHMYSIILLQLSFWNLQEDGSWSSTDNHKLSCNFNETRYSFHIF